MELYALTGTPEYDDDVKEWKVMGVPVRTNWGLVSGSGEWIGGGHRVDGKRRWRQESEREDATLWLPAWWRKPNSEEAIESPPPLEEKERAYVAEIDGYLHILTDYTTRLVRFELLEPLEQWSNALVQAGWKTWDPTANGGNGLFVTDCEDVLLVADSNEVGHNAGTGGYGTVTIHIREDGTPVGSILDLCCPGDEQGSCAP